MFYHIIQAFEVNNSTASHILWILAVNSAPPTYHCFEISTLEMKSCICFVFGVWFVWGRWCSGAKRTDRAASVALLHWDWIKGHERSWGALPVMTCHDTFAPWVRPTTLDSKYMLYEFLLVDDLVLMTCFFFTDVFSLLFVLLLWLLDKVPIGWVRLRFVRSFSEKEQTFGVALINGSTRQAGEKQ